MLKDIMEFYIREKGHSENVTRLQVGVLSSGVSEFIHCCCYRLEADLPGLWSVRSQSLLLTGAHNLLKAQRVSGGAVCSHIALRE